MSRWSDARGDAGVRFALGVRMSRRLSIMQTGSSALTEPLLGWSTAHREGLRERPVDVPATTTHLPRYAVPRSWDPVPHPSRGESRRGEDEKEESVSVVVAETRPTPL